LIGSFYWGLFIVAVGKGKAIEISYSDARSSVTFLSGVSYCDNRERVVLYLTMIQKKKNINTLGYLINRRGLRPPRRKYIK
jgi:hypothetical protein